MTPERAEEIRKAIWEAHGWTAPSQVTPEEDREIKRYWNKLPGGYSYYNVVCLMAKGCHLDGGKSNGS